MVGSPTSPWPVCPQEGHHFSPFFMDFNQAIPVISRSTFFFAVFPMPTVAILRLIPFTLMTFLWAASRIVGDPWESAKPRQVGRLTSHVAWFYKDMGPKHVEIPY